MTSVKRKAYLAYNETAYFGWAGNSYNCKGNKASVIFFEGTGENFKLSQPDCNDVKILTLLSAVEEAVKASTAVSLMEIAVTFKVKWEMSARMCLDETLVKALSDLLTEPTISIEGKFLNSIYFLSDNYPYKVPAMKVLAHNSVKDFEGSTNILGFLGGCTPAANFVWYYSIIVEWMDIQMCTTNEPCIVLEVLFSDKLLTDCCIVTSKETEIHCHRSVLAAQSDVIRVMLTSGLQESQTNKIEMTDISEEVVNLLLAYLYSRPLNTTEMKEEICFDLLRTAHKYNITSLGELMMVTLFNRPNNSFKTNTVLDLYFFTQNVEEFNVLYEKMQRILKANPQQLPSSSSFEDLLENSPKEALKLLELVIN